MTYARLRWQYGRPAAWHVLFGDRLVAWCSRRFEESEILRHRAPYGVPCRQCVAAVTRFELGGFVAVGIAKEVWP